MTLQIFQSFFLLLIILYRRICQEVVVLEEESKSRPLFDVKENLSSSNIRPDEGNRGSDDASSDDANSSTTKFQFL